MIKIPLIFNCTGDAFLDFAMKYLPAIRKQNLRCAQKISKCVNVNLLFFYFHNKD